MREHTPLLYRFLMAFLALILGLSSTSLAETNTRHAVLISIDGLADFHLDNPKLELPNIRELIAEGVWPDHSITVFPSVTHPSHTSLVTGVTPRLHGVVGNRVRNRETGEAYHITNKARVESVRVETLFDWAKAGGRSTASFFWPETKDDPSIDFNIPEVFNSEGNGDIEAVSRSLIEELIEAGIPVDLYFEWYPVDYLRPAGDVLLARAAAYAIECYKPTVLAIHLLATDVTQHEYGPEHYVSQNALTVADHCVGIVREAIEAAGISDETVLIVTGDHGFVTVDYNLNLWPVFEPLGGKLRFDEQGWALFVEPTEQFLLERDRPALEKILDEVRRLEGVARVFSSEEFPELGLPKYEENPLISGRYLVLGKVDNHLRVSPELPPGRFRKEKPYYGHGYLPDHPAMHVGIVIAGSGIRSGVRVGSVRSIDIAPTIAHVLGLETEGIEGRVLTEILE